MCKKLNNLLLIKKDVIIERNVLVNYLQSCIIIKIRNSAMSAEKIKLDITKEG